MNDLETMIQGWKARNLLDRHAQDFQLLAPACRPCAEAAAAWLRGVSLQRIETMYCAEVQAARELIKAADAVAEAA